MRGHSIIVGVMNILAIIGSPRKGGNTELLVDAVLCVDRNGSALDVVVEKVYLNDLRIAPCQDCEDKRGDGSCIVDDNMQLLYPKVLKADIVVLASPIYFGSVSAQVKAMVDRWQCYWLDKSRGEIQKSKKGFFVAVSAQDEDKYFENGRQIAKNFFATIGAEYAGEVLCPNVDAKADILGHKECLEKAKNMI